MVPSVIHSDCMEMLATLAIIFHDIYILFSFEWFYSIKYRRWLGPLLVVDLLFVSFQSKKSTKFINKIQLFWFWKNIWSASWWTALWTWSSQNWFLPSNEWLCIIKRLKGLKFELKVIVYTRIDVSDICKKMHNLRPKTSGLLLLLVLDRPKCSYECNVWSVGKPVPIFPLMKEIQNTWSKYLCIIAQRWEV